MAMLCSCAPKQAIRAYHVVTTQFNYKVNADKAFEQLWNELQQQAPEPLPEVLAAYPPLDVAWYRVQTGQASDQRFERVISKVQEVIERHGMTHVVGDTLQEANPLMAPLYLLLARAQCYNGQPTEALALMAYTQKLFAHDARTVHEAEAVNLLCYMALGQQAQADRSFDILNGYPAKHKTPQTILAKAQYRLYRHEMAQAIPLLRQLIRKSPIGSIRARAALIAGLYAAHEYQSATAIDNLRQAIALGLQRNEELAARLAILRLEASHEPLTTRMAELYKRGIYQQLWGQISYAIGQEAERSGYAEQALQAYERGCSVGDRSSSTGYNRRCLLRAADLGLQRSAYEQAAMRYESWLQLSTTEEKQQEGTTIAERYGLLRELVDAQQVVQREDSLLKLSTARPEVRDKAIERAIEAYRTTLLEGVSNPREARQTSFDEPTPMAGDKADTSDAFYFYNPQIVAAGRALFARKWGNRPLEDHWQRSNKAYEALPRDTANSQPTPDEVQTERLKRDYYLAQLPLTPETQAATRARIASTKAEMARLLERLGLEGQAHQMRQSISEQPIP